MSKRWMAGQLSVLLVCALCLALAWLMGKLPESGRERNGVTLEEPGGAWPPPIGRLPAWEGHAGDRDYAAAKGGHMSKQAWRLRMTGCAGPAF